MGWLGRHWAPVGVVVSLSVWTAVPVCASDALTVNDTGQQGVAGGLFAAPPGSCTGTPGGLPGDCDRRGEALMEASAGTVPGVTFWNDNTWSDLEEAEVPLTENGNTEVGRVTADGTVEPGGASPSPDSDIGTSWLPAFCNHPQCGHLLRGDSLQFDENGDGVFDDTWIDDGDGIREVGEVDRTRGDQFQWGVTSVTRNLGDLSDQLAPGNMFPAGLARARVRMALGAAGQVGDCDVPSITNPACLDGDISSDTVVGAENKVDDNTVNGHEVDADWWGICDPDAFDPTGPSLRDSTITTVEEGQRALENCLWWITSMPIFTTDPIYTDLQPVGLAGGDPLTPGTDDHLFEQHTEWIDQAVTKIVTSSTPDRQNFAESLFVAYYFEQGEPLDQARYQNDWQLLQQDFDPNENVNGPVDPDTGIPLVLPDPVPAGPAKDTYPYAFAIQHRSIGRARGYDNGDIGADAKVAECVGPAVGVDPGDCDGTVNMTVDPFWRAQLVNAAFTLDGMSFNHNFEYVDGEPCDTACRISGVGAEHRLEFLTAQDVNGYFSECMNCDESSVPNFDPQVSYMPYLTGWDVVPTIVHGGI